MGTMKQEQTDKKWFLEMLTNLLRFFVNPYCVHAPNSNLIGLPAQIGQDFKFEWNTKSNLPMI